MLSIKKILYDHWLVSLGVLLAAFLGSAELTSLKLLSDHILPFLSTWYIATIIILSLLLVITLAKLLKNRGPGIAFLAPPLDPPTHKYRKSERFIDTAGVKWKVWRGYDELVSGEDDQRLWVEGPCCAKCLYELDRDKTGKKWHCVECNKYTRIPKHLREDTIENMIKNLTASLERQKRNNLSADS